MNWKRFIPWRHETRSAEVSPELLAAIAEAQEYGPRGYAALKVTGILASLRFLSETIAQLPLKVYERGANPDERTEATDHPVYGVISAMTNEDMTSFEWRERAMLDACIHGDSLNQIVMDNRFNVREIVPLAPPRVDIRRAPGSRKEFWYTRETGGSRLFYSDEILQVPVMLNGLRGRSLVELAGNAVGLAIKAEQFAQRFFDRGAELRYIYELPGGLSKEKVREVSDWLKENYGGSSNFHKIFVAPGGGKVTAHQTEAEKLQLMQTRTYQLEDIARCMRIPPHVIGLLDRATNNNIEQQGIGAVVYCVAPWVRRFEQRFNVSLFGPRERQQFYCEFEMDGLQRGDYQSRVVGMAKEVAGSLKTPNEQRRKLNLPPVEGGDRLYIQGAMVPLQDAGRKGAPAPKQ